MLNKKKFIQKTFRLDEKVNDDFEILSEILERTQNDLANVAIEDMLKENKYWMARNILVDYASDFFFNCNDIKFEVEGIEVEIKYKNNDVIILKVVQKEKDGRVIQTTENEYNVLKENNYEKKIKEILRYYASLIDYNSISIIQYLKDKLNYK